MQHVLLVDDDKGIRELVVEALKAKYRFSTAGTIADAERQIAQTRFDLVLLDVTLPDGDGFRFCAQMRGAPGYQQVPVIFLTGRSEIPDRVLGFSVGGDDYLVKPFHVDELSARIDARLKSATQVKLTQEEIRRGNLRVVVSSQTVYRRDEGDKEQVIDTTPIEFKILLYFLRHEDQTFDRKRLIKEIWGDGAELSERSVDSHISNLRKKLAGCTHTIQSIHKVGYKFTRG